MVVDAAGEIFGDAPNIAARVQAAADPGSVLITTNVHRQVAGLFVAEEQGPSELKGVTEPVMLFRVVRASGGRRFGARALTALVGREEELDLLRRRWERAVTGEGQLALVVGESGIGKSRRSCNRVVGQGGRSGFAPLGLPGGDRASRQGDRDGGQGGRNRVCSQ